MNLETDRKKDKILPCPYVGDEMPILQRFVRQAVETDSGCREHYELLLLLSYQAKTS